MPRKILTTVVTAVVGLMLATGVSVAVDEAPLAPVPKIPSTTKFIDLKGRDGIKIGTNVTVPTTPGPHPLVVIPASWGGGNTQNIVPAWRLGERGYIAINYAARGFGDSGGTVDLGGPEDMKDLSAIIDWALANTPADPNRIGVFGISYAGGIALLGAALEPRIKAAVAMEGWADLERALYPNRTPSGFVALGLRLSGTFNGRLNGPTQKMFDDFFAHNNIEGMRDLVRARSPWTYLGQTNARGPAIMIQQELNETVFPVDQMVDYYNALTGPKRLELMPGDHISHFVSSLVAIPNVYMDSMIRWFDAHLSGIDPTIAREAPVKIVPRSTNGWHPAEPRPDWASVTTGGATYQLGAREGLDNTGRIGPGARADWSTTITSGMNVVASAGVPLVSFSLEAFFGIPPSTPLWLVDRGGAMVWRTEPYATTTRLRGAARLRTTVTPSAANGTMIAYLYDLDATGTGYLIGHVPHSWTGETPNRPISLDVSFYPQAYDVPAGHRLALVITTKDLLYSDWNALGAPMTFSSSPADPSHLYIPFG